MTIETAKIAVARAVRTSIGTWHGEFALPGTAIDQVRLAGEVRQFDDAQSADHAALQAFFDKYRARTSAKARKGAYMRPSPADFAGLLAECGISPTLFAMIYGVPASRAMSWVNGDEDIPHAAHLVASLLRSPDNLSDAIGLAESCLARQQGE